MRKLLLLAFPMLFFGCSSEKGEGPVYASEGVAIGGYDLVAYFEQGEPKIGIKAESVEHNGFTYLFSSKENKELFQRNPGEYLPAYGGWCAYAVAETSSRMAPNPEIWQIQNGKLQLFYDNWKTRLFGSLKSEWNEDPDDFKSRADVNWQKMN